MSDLTDYKEISIISFLSSQYGIEAKQKGRLYMARLTGKEGFDTTIFEFDGKFKNWSQDKSGNIFDLVQMIEGCDFMRAKEIIDSYNGVSSLRGNPTKINYQAKSDIKPVQPEKLEIIGNIHPSLIYYATSRYISRKTVLKYCKQVNISKYFHLGFKNDKGGYVLRNKFAKRNTGKSAISSILVEGSTVVNVFEGFFDFLTYKEVYPGGLESCIVLNSTANLTKEVIEKLSSFSVVKCWFDNDDAGNQAYSKIEGNKQDMRYKYKSHNDLNSYFINFKQKRK
jgi:hypothetical protein